MTTIKLVVFDFDGVFTTGNVIFNEDGRITKSYNVKDGMALKILKQHNIKFGIITGFRENTSTKAICEHLGVERFSSNIKYKIDLLQEWMNELNIASHEIAFMGDDLNDIECLNFVGVSGCPANAVKECKQNASYVCKNSGGCGAVREFVDFIIQKATSKSNNTISALISKQSLQYQKFIHNLDPNDIEHLVSKIKHLRHSEQVIYLIGVGKSGHVAKCVSDLFKSISIRSFALDSNNLLHGNLGIINQGSFIILLTKSGNTKELIDLSFHLNKRKCDIWCISMNTSGKLASKVSKNIFLPHLSELETKFNKVPTSSLLGFITYFNIVISTIVETDDAITPELYGANHPNGDIGLSIYLKVSDVMKPLNSNTTFQESQPLSHVIRAMNSERESIAVITDRMHKLSGVCTDFDIRNYLINAKALDLNTPISQIMKSNPFTCGVQTSVKTLLQIFKTNDLKYFSGIPIIERDDIVVGIVHGKDLVRFL